jgi:hypothetical protein
MNRNKKNFKNIDSFNINENKNKISNEELMIIIKIMKK